jgi:hypothetical protein
MSERTPEKEREEPRRFLDIIEHACAQRNGSARLERYEAWLPAKLGGRRLRRPAHIAGSRNIFAAFRRSSAALADFLRIDVTRIYTSTIGIETAPAVSLPREYGTKNAFPPSEPAAECDAPGLGSRIK